ncbi:Oidioi.mRNA.OKI2018_I69.PAR.g11845.t1.cds [Oikopleura dioica]|uniref:Oidioi.mRNA.OKI2018_I69.PAR.g11845.t1.cds n=1 Tax=Oikopleura dioica TaxID=34765 RepID=A0ABN7RXM8_OIKDI|nr:Oidioi.mRNA.OKI2018_I69.PAR.g11845.t1.cds [Oikopleura dioica]
MDDIDKLIEALRLNEKKFNEEEIRANSWKIFTNPEMSIEIEALYQRGLKLQEKRKKEEMERIMEEEIKLAKESWFEKSDDQDPFDELEKSIEVLNNCFVQMENDFGHPSKLTTEKLEKAANDILEQKRKLGETVKNLSKKLENCANFGSSTAKALKIEEAAYLRIETEVVFKETFLQKYEESRSKIENTLSIFQGMPEENRTVLKESLKASVEDLSARIAKYLDEGEKFLKGKTLESRIAKDVLKKVFVEMEKCQANERKLNEEWSKLRKIIDVDVDRMRKVYVRLKALEPIADESCKEMEILMEKINIFKRDLSAAELDAKSELVKDSPINRQLASLCGFESSMVRKDELEEKLHSLIREKEARRMEVILQNEEKAREVSREFLKAQEQNPPIQLANKSEATLQHLASL